MKIKIKCKFPMQEILKSMKVNSGKNEDIMVLDASDKFFVGGGCEAMTIVLDSPDESDKTDQKLQNLSICMTEK